MKRNLIPLVLLAAVLSMGSSCNLPFDWQNGFERSLEDLGQAARKVLRAKQDCTEKCIDAADLTDFLNPQPTVAACVQRCIEAAGQQCPAPVPAPSSPTGRYGGATWWETMEENAYCYTVGSSVLCMPRVDG